MIIAFKIMRSITLRILSLAMGATSHLLLCEKHGFAVCYFAKGRSSHGKDCEGLMFASFFCWSLTLSCEDQPFADFFSAKVGTSHGFICETPSFANIHLRNWGFRKIRSSYELRRAKFRTILSAKQGTFAVRLVRKLFFRMVKSARRLLSQETWCEIIDFRWYSVAKRVTFAKRSCWMKTFTWVFG